MAQSLAYAFILNMWVMGRIDENFVNGQHRLNRITQEELDMILATPQNAQ